MDRIRIVGGRELNGTIPISGAKNATLPLMIASMLTDQTLILDNVPRLADVNLLQRILSNHGVDYSLNGKRPGEAQTTGRTLHLQAREVLFTGAVAQDYGQVEAEVGNVGISYSSRSSKTPWIAKIKYLKEFFYGRFSNKESAIEFYDKISLYFHGPT